MGFVCVTMGYMNATTHALDAHLNFRLSSEDRARLAKLAEGSPERGELSRIARAAFRRGVAVLERERQRGRRP